MALKFQRGSEAMEQADKSRGGGNRYTPYVKWATGEKKYVQFLTPMDEVPGVLFHQFIITEYNEKGEPTFNNFISPRDKSLDGPSGSDEIQDRFDVNPLYRLFSVAVEMEPVQEKVNGKLKTTGYEPKMRQWTDREDNDHESVVAGLIIQAKPNFFGHLATWQEETGKDLTEVIWSVSRDTNKKQPTYTFVEVGEALDVSEFGDDLPDLDKTLQEWGDMDRYEQLITPLPDDFPISQYGQRGKKKADDAKPARRSSTRSKAKEEPEEAAPEEDFQSTEEKASTRKGKLSRLRQSIEEKDEADDAGDDDDE